MKRRWPVIGILGCLVMLGGLAISQLYAVGTAYWEINDKANLRKGDLENLVMTPDGKLVLGKTTRKLEAKEQSFWTSVVTKRGETYFGTGSGKVYKLTDKGVGEFFASGEILVTALLAGDDDKLYAATIPHGKIFKIETSGKITGTVFSTLPSAYVWGLTYGADRKNIYAATGPDGKLYEIDAQGKAKVFYDTKKPVNILSFIFDGQDYFYYGTANPGLLYRLSLKGKPELLADFGDAELKSLVYDGKNLYIAANGGAKMPPQEFLNAVTAAAGQPEKVTPTPAQQQPPAPPTPPTPKTPEEESVAPASENPPEMIQPTPPPPENPKPPVNGSIYKLLAGGVMRELIGFSNCYLTEIRINANGDLFAGTDNSGKVFQIDQDGRFTIPLDVEANQVLTIQLTKEGNLALVGTGGPGAVYLMDDKEAPKGSYLSEVFDAKFIAQWGNFHWKGKGKLGFQSRSGNTVKPDETWSDWSDEKNINAEELVRATSNPARFFQFKLNWKGGETELKETSFAYLINNQPPKIAVLTVAYVPQPVQPPLQPGQPQPPAAPRMAIIKINWQAMDVDGDPVGYRLYYKKDDLKNWVPLNPEGLVFANEFNWDTSSLPDGRYQVKLIATDEKANAPAPDWSVQDEKISPPFIVDNTRPEITELKMGKDTITGKAVDNLGPIKLIQYSVDGGEWNLLYPKDNIMDDKTEEFEVSLKDLKKGLHTVIIRAYDEAGNLGLTQQEVEIK